MDRVRTVLGDVIRTRVSGPEGADRVAAIVEAEGPRWFDSDRPVRHVHADAAMFVGGLRAVLLQSLHPVAMAGVAQHSDYRDDPWGRLQRTAHFLALTTFGTAEQAQGACARVRAVHATVRGVTRDGRPYTASDPHLLEWVHVAEVESFWLAYRAYGQGPATPLDRDGYVQDMARVARELGVPEPPTTWAGVQRRLRQYRPELRVTPEAREAARFLAVPPGVALPARVPYGVLFGAAASLLGVRDRLALRIPVGPVAGRLVVQPAGEALVRTMRWALGTSPHAEEGEGAADLAG